MKNAATKKTEPQTHSGEIGGLQAKSLRRYVDERGDFREILRSTDEGFPGFAQASASIVYEGIAKAWHLHWKQTESMTVLWGIVKFAFADRRKDSPSFGVVKDFIVDSRNNPLLFTVPPGVAHGYRVILGPAVILYLANQIYDPSDQVKIPHDAADIGYAWAPPVIG